MKFCHVPWSLNMGADKPRGCLLGEEWSLSHSYRDQIQTTSGWPVHVQGEHPLSSLILPDENQRPIRLRAFFSPLHADGEEECLHAVYAGIFAIQCKILRQAELDR